MPVVALRELTDDESLLSIAARLAHEPPGLVFATGAQRSGKLTMLE